MADITTKLAEALRVLRGRVERDGATPLDLAEYDAAVDALAQYEQAKPAEQLPHGLLEEAARLASEHQSGPWEMQVRYTLRRFLEVLSAPVARAEPRKPLTDDQVEDILYEGTGANRLSQITFARAIEAAHGIKEKP